MLKYANVRYVDHLNFNDLVKDTYNKIYSLQQTYGGWDRQSFNFTATKNGKFAEGLPTKINEDDWGEGIDFKTWLNTPCPKNCSFSEELFWERNFHPYFDDLVLDLCQKGLIEEGDYVMNIDW